MTKFLLFMRLTCFLLIAGCLSANARTYSQKVTLKLNRVPLENVFKSIQQQTGYIFFYDEALLKSKGVVSADIKQATLSHALTQCFNEKGLSFTIVGKTIVVKAALMELHYAAEAPEKDIRGVVKNDQGELLEGATIIVKGTGKGRTTDRNGAFEFKGLDPGAILLVSSIGHETQEISVGKQTFLSVVLKVKPEEMQAAVTVSTGYQNLKRINLAGSATTIKASELSFNGVNTIEQALQGRIPGVVVLNNNGMVGTRQRTIVRGVSTLSGSQDPIWVVDGMTQQDPLPFKAGALDALGNITPDNFDFVRNFVGNAISWLNPNDIEDITVLKDASATAIYGVRAGNGVIVINTKKGKEGPPSVTYSNTINVGERVTYDRLEKMNSLQRVAVSREMFERGLITSNYTTDVGFAGALDDYLFGRISYEQFNARVHRLETNNVDWFNILFRTPVSVNQNVNISGGSAANRYYASFGYSSNNGTAIGNGQKNYTVNLGLNSIIGKKINTNMRVSASHIETEGFYRADPYSYASTINRALPAYDSSGGLLFYKQRSGYLFNIVNELANSGSVNSNTSVNLNLNIDYQLHKNIRFNTMFSLGRSNVTGYTYATERSEYIAGIRKYDFGTVKPLDAAYKASPLPLGGELNTDDNQSTSWNWRNSLNYTKVFALKHALSVMLGQESNSAHYTGFSSTNYGYLPERGKNFAELPVTITSGTTTSNNTLLLNKKAVTDRITNTMGLYATLNYAFDNRYVLNASVRTDASNRFGQFTGEKFSPVYAAGLRWNMMYEPFAKNWYWLNAFSLRATYGFQRNIVTTVSPELIARTPSSDPVDVLTGESRLVVSSLPYGDLRWEKTGTVNLGFDFGLFRNRISGTIEYYVKKGKDIITSLDIPIEYGVVSMPVNGGSLTNKGLEISLAVIPVQTKDITLSLSVNTSKTYNKLDEAGILNPTFRTAASGNYNRDGYPVSAIWAFRNGGINKTNGVPVIDLTVDQTKDSINDPTAYMQYVGKLNPDFTGGGTVGFRYKMFSVNTTFYLQLGGKKFLTPLYAGLDNQTPALPPEYENLSAELADRWTLTNPNGSLPGLLPSRSTTFFILPDGKSISNVYQMYNYSAARVVDASTLRVNNISLSYTLPQSVSSRIRSKNLSLAFVVTNAFAWVSSDFKGRDSEVATGAQPRTRSYSFRINATF